MFRKALVFALIGSALIALPTTIAHYAIGFSLETYSIMEVIGYASILLSMSMVFLSIRSHRQALGGAITFGRAFRTGMLTAGLLSLLICLFVAATFRLMFDEAQISIFTETARQKMISDGKSPADIEKDMKMMEAVAGNAILQGLVMGVTTFLIGLGCSILFALTLKKKPQPAA